jgi:hypothetical protein
MRSGARGLVPLSQLSHISVDFTGAMHGFVQIITELSIHRFLIRSSQRINLCALKCLTPDNHLVLVVELIGFLP